MAGIYRQHHPERTVLYRLLFHYFDEFLSEYEQRFEREYGYFRPVVQEVVEKYLDCGNPKCGFARMRCPSCGAQMKIIAFIEDPMVIDKIIAHLKLTFHAERPPPPQIVQKELMMASEEQGEYF